MRRRAWLVGPRSLHSHKNKVQAEKHNLETSSQSVWLIISSNKLCAFVIGRARIGIRFRVVDNTLLDTLQRWATHRNSPSSISCLALLQLLSTVCVIVPSFQLKRR